MPLTVPAGIPSNASWRVWFVPTMTEAQQAAPSLATNINGASTVDASCLIVKDSGIGMGVDVEKFKDERLCSVQSFEQNGNTTYTMDDITYIADPQTPASAANKLYAAVGAGANGFLVIRWGMPADTTAAVGQKVWTVPVSFAPAIPLPPESNSLTRARQSLSVTGVVQRDVAVVA